MRSKRSIRSPTLNRFCRCIKTVRNHALPKKVTHTNRRKREERAIAICVSSVLQRKGRTLKRFRCRSPAFLQTQAYPRPSRR